MSENLTDSKRTILLVEDEDILAFALTHWLNGVGYNCIYVSSGEKAIEIVKNTNIDLILMDIDLGKGIDGTQAAEVILKDYNIPILFLSSHTEKEIVEKTERISSYGYVVKDANYSVLLASIKMTFKLHDANQELLNQKKALYLSEEKFSKAFYTSPDAIGITRLKDGVYVEINEGFTKISGYTPEEIVGRSVLPDDLGIWVNIEERTKFVKNILDNTGVNSLETFFRIKDGSIRTGLITGNIIELEGEPCILTIVRDVTDQKRSEEALRSSEERFRGIADNIPGIVFQSFARINGEIGLYYVSEQSKELLGLDNKPLSNYLLRFAEQNTPDDYAKFLQSINQAVQSFSKWDFEGKFTRPDGKILFFKGIAQPRYVNDEMIFDGVLLDITQRKQFEEALLHSQERFRQVSETAKEWIWEIDRDGIYSYSNSVVEKILGYKPEELVGKKHFYDLWSDETKNALLDQVVDAFINKEILYRLENPVYNKNGNVVILETTGLPIINDNGQLIGYRGTDVDITERKLAEESLALEKSLTEAVFNSVPGIIYLYNDQGKLLRWNKQHEVMTGYSSEELSRMNLLDWFKGDDQSIQAVTQGVQRTIETGFGDAQAELQRKDGVKIPMYFTASSLILKGKVCFAGIGIDITERKRAEEALHKSEEYYRSLIENSSDLIVVTDLEGKFKYASPSVFNILGFTPDEFVVQDSMKTIHPEDLATKNLREEYTRISKAPGLSTSNFMRVLHKNGSWRFLETIGKTAYDQNGELIVISNMRDITERIEADKELRRYRDHLVEMVEERTSELEQSRETFRALAENTKDVIMRVNEKFQFLYMNSVINDVFGVPAEQYIGKTFSELGFADNLINGFEELLKKVFENKQNHRREFQLQNGRWGDLLAMPEFDTNGEVCSIIISARDISEIKKLQHEIENALEKEKELNQLKDRFISVVSHEYRTPLTSILSSVEILELGDKKYSEEKKKIHFDRIQKNIDYLISMLDEVLYVNRIESERIQVAYQRINVRNFCKEIFDEIKEQYPGIKSTIKINLHDDYCNMDVSILRKVLGNVISNAYKYNRENGEVLFVVNSRSNKLTFEISDTGIGIPEDEQKNVFEAFSRMTNTQHIKGTGLGLSIVKKSIEQLGGTVSFESKLNKGTTFTVSIPIN
jgi:PAS domain S-box-containing protein